MEDFQFQNPIIVMTQAIEVINVDGDQKNGICASLSLYRKQNQYEDSPVIKIGTQCDTMGRY